MACKRIEAARELQTRSCVSRSLLPTAPECHTTEVIHPMGGPLPSMRPDPPPVQRGIPLSPQSTSRAPDDAPSVPCCLSLPPPHQRASG